MALLLAAALASAADPEWSAKSEVIDGNPVCTLQRDFQGGTRLIFMAFDPIWKDGHFNLIAENSSWSLHDGDRVGSVKIVAPSYEFRGPAEAGDGYFTVFVRKEALEPFLASASDGGFEISRENGRTVGTFTAGNLDLASREFVDCVNVKLGVVDDPFAG